VPRKKSDPANDKAAAKAYLAGGETQKSVADRFGITLPRLHRALAAIKGEKTTPSAARAEEQARAKADPSGLAHAALSVAKTCADCERLRRMNTRLLQLIGELLLS